MHSITVPAPPGGATVVCFPQDRNVGRVRHVAALILKRASEKDRVNYWNQVCSRLAGALEKVGISDDEISRQIEGLSRAVSLEMSMLSVAEQRLGPGGAA